MTIALPKGYEITPRENYSYDLFSDWWPTKWKGGAWICPNKHQIPKEKYDWGFNGGNKYNAFCPGCNRWVDRKLIEWDPIEKQCTMGYARRQSEIEEDDENERDDKAVSASVEVPARRENRKRRSTGYSPGNGLDSGKTRRRKSKRLVGSGSK